MKSITITELRADTAAVRRSLEAEHDIMVTVKSRPFALLTRVRPDTVEEEIMALRLARGRVAIDRIRAKAKADGRDKMTMKEIDAIIADVRSEMRSGK